MATTYANPLFGANQGLVAGRPMRNTADDPDAESLSYDQSGAASNFADLAQNNYGQATQDIAGVRDYYQGLIRGDNSIAAEQLRQGLQQNLAAQRSMAASAAPQNAAMAARTAAIQSGRLGSGMAGQAALAGLQERRDAQNSLGQLMLGSRGQDVQAALGSRGNAVQALGNVLGKPKEPGFWDYATGLAGAGLSALALRDRGGTATSDERAKDDIKDADSESKKMLDGLRAYTYRYKDEKHGKGKQYGIMAQDLERSGLGHAVIDTPEGKQVHGAKLATGLAALVSSVHRRVSKLEGKGK